MGNKEVCRTGSPTTGPSTETSKGVVHGFRGLTMEKVPSRALSGALLRAPRFLRALLRAFSGALFGVSLIWAYNPGGHLKNCRSPSQEKCRKKCFGKCRSETGCRRKCSGSGLLYYLYIGAEEGALFSARSSAPRFRPALSEALFRHFSWLGLRHFFRWPPGS